MRLEAGFLARMRNSRKIKNRIEHRRYFIDATDTLHSAAGIRRFAHQLCTRKALIANLLSKEAVSNAQKNKNLQT